MRLKKILILVAIPVVVITPLPFVLSSCNKTKAESDWMWSLYQDHDKNRNKAIYSDLSTYTSNWKKLANNNHKTNNHREIQYAVEYSLFSFIYAPNVHFMTTFGITNSLFSLLNDNSSGVYVTFQTTYCDFKPETLLVSYVGSMTLNFTKNVTLNDSGFILGENDVIQCVYSFNDAAFNNQESQIADEWLQDTYSPSPQIGDSLGFVQIVRNNAPYGNLERIENVETTLTDPNYFNAKAYKDFV